MPRRDAFDGDSGDDGIVAPQRRSTRAILQEQQQLRNQQRQKSSSNNGEDNGDGDDDDPDLVELEKRLNEEVDEEFFADPVRFNTLHRVIDVLGLKMIDDATCASEHSDLEHNPAYRDLMQQREVVEGAIEHMAVIHCADLNGSVIQVGRVARQFSEAVVKVRSLRKQVRDIQDSLGGSSAQQQQPANPNEASGGSATAAAAAAAAAVPSSSMAPSAMSLRQLWMKKLECEATLSLLDKLDVIRAAPARFDQLTTAPCRIGAAVLTVSQALQTMFSDDVAQVQALHKIMEQLMMRKQKAEEIIWDTLQDVIYLRTGNGLATEEEAVTTGKGGGGGGSVSKGIGGSGQSVSSDSWRSPPNRLPSNRLKNYRASSTSVVSFTGMINPFTGTKMRFAVEEDLDDVSVDSDGSGASLFSLEDGDIDDGDSVGGSATGGGGGGNRGSSHRRQQSSNSAASSIGKADAASGIGRLMIPLQLIEAELDLEADERRCLEEIALSSAATGKHQHFRHQKKHLPRYADPVLALRILVECLAQLKRLDDVERVLQEGLEQEIRSIVQREQARTFQRLEKKRLPKSIRMLGKVDNLQEFRRHLTGLMSAFGCVLLRLAHLAEILRFRIKSDEELMHKMESPSSFMRPAITAAYDMMQKEITEFLKACLSEANEQASNVLETAIGKGSSGYESGLFSLGIVESTSNGKDQGISIATRGTVMEMTSARFVSKVLFPKTKSEPQVRHALSFRRSVARWTAEIEALFKELANVTNEDTSATSFKAAGDHQTIDFLDKVIQNDLLPVLQEDAVNGTVVSLERPEAFDPVLDRSVYSTPTSNDPENVDMCLACQALYKSTGPLFLALHRLPRGGEMYLPLVAVLEHVLLTFISRVKQQVSKICTKKTAFILLSEEKDGMPFDSVMERRRPFSLLLRAYANGDLLEGSASAGEDLSKQSGFVPLAPPDSDASSRNQEDQDPVPEDLADGVEGEELVLEQELAFLRPYMDFGDSKKKVVCSTDEELMKASCLAHSLLKLSSLLESRLKVRGDGSGPNKTLTSTRALREAIKTLKMNGIKMAKFCRIDMLMQTLTRLSKICTSSTLVARDAVRIPSSVNDLGEYLTGASDNLREASGHAVTGFTLSSLEQYIPLSLMETVRAIAKNKGIVTKSPLTMNGIEALDRSGSVLYRDLKGATSFDNSFWDVELAAVSFEQSASFIAMVELEMEELVAYYTANQGEFSESDFELMFSMTGPRRRGDVKRYRTLNRRKR